MILTQVRNNINISKYLLLIGEKSHKILIMINYLFIDQALLIMSSSDTIMILM